MISSIPGPPHSPSPAPSGTRDAAGERGEGFATALARADQLHPRHSIPGLEFAPLLEAQGAAVTDAGRGAASGSAGQAASAERFNEHGFFGKAVDAGSAPISPPETLAAPVEQAPATDAPLSTAGLEPAGPAIVEPGRPARAVSTHAHAVNVPPSGPATGLGVGAASARLQASAPEAGEGLRMRTASSVGRRRLPAAAEMSAGRVALRELEQGVAVAIQAAALDEPERTRLRDEIAALLARHGLRANDIRINARVASRPREGEN